MAQVSGRKSATTITSRIYAKRRRRRKLRGTISNRTIITAMSLLSKQYDLRPCCCEHDRIRTIEDRQALISSKSSNAFWQRKNKSNIGVGSGKQQRNNSTAFKTPQMSSTHSSHLQKFRTSLVQRLKGNNKRKMPTITARSVIRKRTTTTNAIEHKSSIDHPSVDLSNTFQTTFNRPSLAPHDSQLPSDYSNDLASEDNLYDENEEDENDTLKPLISSFKIEQQNINATNNTSRTIQETSQTMMNELDLSRKTKASAVELKRKKSSGTRQTSLRATTSSSKRKKSSKQKRPPKRKTPLSNAKTVSSPKRKKSTSRSSATRSKTTIPSKTHTRSPFPNPNLFHSLLRMQNSDEITKDNVHKNHLCCKPITSVKSLSTNDQKKLIEHDYLTLISLLPIYLGSHGNFQNKLREKTNITADGAIELDRLMNEWGSARLFIGASNHNKTLTQTI